MADSSDIVCMDETKSRRVLCARALLAAAIGWVAAVALTPLSLPGGDTNALLIPNPYAYYMIWGEGIQWLDREPLAALIVQWIYTFVHDKALALDINSYFFGGVYAALLWAHRPRWRFLLPNLLTVNILIFCAHKELYPPVLAAFIGVFCLMDRSVRSGRGRHWAVAAWAASLALHKGFALFAPAVALLFLEPAGGWRWRINDRGEAQWGLGFFLTAILALQVPLWMALAGHPVVQPLEYKTTLTHQMTLPHGWAERIMAVDPTGGFQLFYFGDLTHMAYFLGFTLAAAPLGVALVLAFGRRLKRPVYWPFAVASAISVVFVLCWHPHLGWRDWDLFCMMLTPVNFLAGTLWSDGPEAHVKLA